MQLLKSEANNEFQ